MRTDMLQQLEGVVRRAGDIVREAHDIERATMEKHGAADLVTKYDVAVQGFLQRELLALLPEELRAVMKPCTKYTDNTGNSMEAAAVTATQEWLFLLSEWEYYGARTMANEGEQSFQQQYAYLSLIHI